MSQSFCQHTLLSVGSQRGRRSRRAYRCVFHVTQMWALMPVSTLSTGQGSGPGDTVASLHTLVAFHEVSISPERVPTDFPLVLPGACHHTYVLRHLFFLL